MAQRMMNTLRTAAPRMTMMARASPVALRAPVSLRSRFGVIGEQQRFYATGSLSQDQIKARILDVLQSFEKVDPNKLNATASFTSDLGLDSLDAVEVVMAIEEEFSIEIPDEEADRITTVGEAIDYIAKSPEAH